MILANVVGIKRDGSVVIHCGMEYEFPPSYFPKDIRIGDIVYLNERISMFTKIKKYEKE